MPPTPKKANATIDATNNFFQRGKKASTAQRVVTVKNSVASSQKDSVVPVRKRLAKDEDEDHEHDEDEYDDEIVDDTDSSEDEHASYHSEQEEASDRDDEHRLIDDEIESDDSDNDVDDLYEIQKPTSPVKKSATLGVDVGSRSTSTSAKLEAKEKVAKAKSTKRGGARSKKETYVVPYVGDIHTGFHQTDISPAEKALRQFDLASKYGPCTDLTRLERWERAFELGLNPPQEVKDMIMEHMSLNVPVFEGRV
ncbi:DNA polymerase delta, subunit 4-domain-containing protein [Mortierella sp. GBAus27b]|nr:hypothetical protein BGX31_007245 [Mortierella sp. GBA43]KAI8362328.1 DNA polymerase delta, subunit 4-domain-containing protein [Mortierella sp. GBAus27b]